MREVWANIDKRNKWLIVGTGVLCFLIYVVCLYFRPQESWCDDAFWADWARQLAEHNRYYTTVWGFGHPSYCPLYVFLMALWYKVVGFSFFAAQFPNIVLTLITYWLLMLILIGRTHVTSWQGIASFSALYWFAPSMMWIYNCGRIEVLCMLLGLLTGYSFVSAVETGLTKYKIGLFAWGLLLFATGVEGVVFATLFILIYSAYHWREAWQNKMLYVWHFGSYVTSLGVLGVITWKTHCLHQFFDTMFGFSKTFTSLYLYFRALVKGAKNGEVVEAIPQPSGPKSPLWQSLVEGLTNNPEYLVLIAIVLALFVWLCYREGWKKISVATKVMTTMAVLAPIVYVLAGRYTSYYTWAAYIPCIIALVILVEQLSLKWMHVGVGALMVIWFFVNPYNRVLRSLDFNHEKDRQNIADIAVANINPNVPTCIPYSWYYYIVEGNENIWFQASGAYPDDLSVIIYAPDEYNEENFMNRYQLQERCRIGNKIVYDIIGKNE